MGGRTCLPVRTSDLSTFEIPAAGQAHSGFQPPQAGDQITCLTDFVTLAGHHIKIPAGAVGQVVDVSLQTDTSHPYTGVCATFQEISAHYPAGIVIPLDYASDPRAFSYTSSGGSPVPKPA